MSHMSRLEAQRPTKRLSPLDISHIVLLARSLGGKGDMPPHNRASNVNSTPHDTLAEGAEALSKQTTCADLGVVEGCVGAQE